MKDYLLSEIKSHDWHENWEISDDITKGHREYNFLRELQRDLDIYDIEPRDMIELPCKQKVVVNEKEWWFVYLRMENGFITNQAFELEEEADAFLQELKNGKV